MNERDLPLTALRAFAIAAHAPNLAAAAKQLGVTHGAVSKQIGVLEAWLGQALFARHKRALELTPYGRILAERVSASIRDIGEACTYVRRDRTRRVIAVEAPVTFALYFLLPRVKAFEAQHDGVSVWISTRVTGQAADLAKHDIVISRGPLAQGGLLLFQERLTPVGASALLRQNPVRRAADIGSHTAIASSSRPGDREAWFAHAGLGSPLIEGGHRFDHLHVALHAVQDGLGLTIAPSLFFDGPAKPHRLRCPLPAIYLPGESYFAYGSHRPQTREAALFTAWLQAQCA
jgi:LysR family glycine cleavage system transcriptional activator